MSALPLPMSWSPALSMLAKTRGSVRDPRVALLRSIVEYVEGAIVTGLRGVKPSQAPEAAEELFRRHAATWARGWTFAAQLATEAGLVDEAKLGEDVLSLLGSLPRDIRIRLPKLTADARRDLRATILLLGGLVTQVRTDLPFGSIDALREAGDKAKAHPIGMRFMAVLECLLVIGERGGVPDKVVDALALALWRMIREDAPEDAVEDAYLSAVAMEAKERRERVVPFRRSTGRASAARRKRASGS
jgi:hypothetical protein